MRSKAGCFVISVDGIYSSASSGLLNAEPSSQQLPVRFPVGDPESEEPLGFGSTCGRSRKQSMTGRPPWVANHLHASGGFRGTGDAGVNGRREAACSRCCRSSGKLDWQPSVLSRR
jgi:hypothetical protein